MANGLLRGARANGLLSSAVKRANGLLSSTGFLAAIELVHRLF